jgi:hypothetical protein
MKPILRKISVIAIAALMGTSLSGCLGLTGNVSADITTIQQLAAEIDAGATAIEASTLPLACSIAGQVYQFGTEAMTANLIPNTPKIQGDIAIFNSLYTNPGCVQAIGGNIPTNALVLIADIGQAILDIKVDTGGKVTATGVVTGASKALLTKSLRKYYRLHHMQHPVPGRERDSGSPWHGGALDTDPDFKVATCATSGC